MATRRASPERLADFNAAFDRALSARREPRSRGNRLNSAEMTRRRRAASPTASRTSGS